jgi:protein phosphatase PTC2/3
MNRCLAPDCQMGGLGCDNMTVILVCFLNGEPYKKLAEKCKLTPLPLSHIKNLNNNTVNITNNNNLSSLSQTSSAIPYRRTSDEDL